MWVTRLPWILALVWLAVRWGLGAQLDVESAQNAGVLVNMLFILLLVFLGIGLHYRRLEGRASGFLEDFKACMKPTLLYVLMALIFIGVYYTWLSDDIQELRAAYIETFNEGIKDENNLNNFLSQHPEEKGKTVEELMQKNRDNVERNVSVQTRIMGGSLALTFIAVVYSLLAVFFWRTFVRKW
jgi:predicted PurR-regulated permease PerM